MLFRIKNRDLIENKERTFLTKDVDSGDTSLTVRAVESDEWSDNDFLILGEIGTPNAELLQINGNQSDGTTLVIDDPGSGGTRYNHSADEPIYRISFNEIRLYHSDT